MRLFKVLSISMVSQVVFLAAGFFNNIIITRNLSLSQRGQYALAMNLIIVLGLILGDGLYRSNTYLISRKPDKLSPLVSNSILAIVIFSLLAALLLLPFRALLFTRWLAGLDTRLLLLALLSVLPYISIRSANGLFLGLQWYVIYNIFIIAPLTLFCLLNVLLVIFFHFSLINVLFNYFLAMASLFVFAYLYLYVKKRFRFTPSRTMGKLSLSTGLKSSASSISLYMLFRVDIFLINYYLGNKAAGLYSIAVVLAELLQKFANTAGTVILPKISSEEKMRQGHRISGQVLVLVAAVGLLFAAVMIPAGKQIIVFLYKSIYEPSYVPLMWLLPGTIVMAVGKIYLFSLWGRGFPPATWIVPLGTFLLNVCLNILLIPRFGIAGAAMATSFSYCCFGVVIGIVYHRYLRAANGE
ncbi:oligosaccharide flippase family protein [candidate division KSB1 bacterium]|nr:oligosaccharide flippase family protein [candidate division KSB1 bacterium]